MLSTTLAQTTWWFNILAAQIVSVTPSIHQLAPLIKLLIHQPLPRLTARQKLLVL
jgi:hypothetical protein